MSKSIHPLIHFKAWILIYKHYSKPNFSFYSPDPLVLAAWRCKKLSEIVFIGQRYSSDNLLAIVRLRHNMLKRLEFAESDIVYEELWAEHEAIMDVSSTIIFCII